MVTILYRVLLIVIIRHLKGNCKYLHLSNAISVEMEYKNPFNQSPENVYIFLESKMGFDCIGRIKRIQRTYTVKKIKSEMFPSNNRTAPSVPDVFGS